MGTTLTGTTPQDTYDSLIKVTDNGPLSGSLKVLTDGLGNNSSLALSTTAASLSGTLAVSGAATFDTTTLVVDAANNRVGVGAATPLGKLDLIHGDTSPVGLQDVAIDALRISRATGGLTAIRSAQFDAALQPAAGDIQFLNLFFNGSTYNYYERMRINAAGNVGIGTNAPAALLDLTKSSAGVINTSLIIRNPNSSVAGTGSKIYFSCVAGNDRGSYIESASTVDADNSTYLAFATNSAGANATEKVRVLSSGGITFNGDTAAANALDDYEEGTWTMGVSFGGASVGVTSVQGGTYTKIGRQVTVNGNLSLTNKGSSSGDSLITGLPFTIANTTGNRSAASVSFYNLSFADQLTAEGVINSTTIGLIETTNAGVGTIINNSDFANNTVISISLTYFV